VTTTRTWLLLVAGQLALLALLAAGGTALESRAAAAGGAPPAALMIPIRVLGVAALVGFVACVPPTMVRVFVAAQLRIGNGAHPLVAWLARHETAVVRATLGVWTLGALIALPLMIRDATSAGEETDVPARAAGVASGDAWPVTTPAPGTPSRDAILDAVRARIGSTGRFRVGHIRMAGGWAFVRATEVVTADGEEQETDLSVMALLVLPEGEARGAWAVTEIWTLPWEPKLPLTDFTRRVRARAEAGQFPAALLPDDLR
jgi:hypothetical protein